MRFYLGTHKWRWLTECPVPLFVSRRVLPKARFAPAVVPWALDSGGFTELSMYGEWRTSASTYAADVRRYQAEVGMLEWCAPQDWMCEPFMLAKTGRGLLAHQRLTVRSYLDLRYAELPVIPVLQGWVLDDYLRCIEEYEREGVALAELPLVGLGSVCRRQDTRSAAVIVRRLAAEGIRLHGFGIKIKGLDSYWDALASCDSMAWSLDARVMQRRGQPSCDPSKRKACNNCLHYALSWYRERVAPKADPDQQPLWEEVPCTAALLA